MRGLEVTGTCRRAMPVWLSLCLTALLLPVLAPRAATQVRPAASTDEPKAESDASTPEFRRAVELQRKGRYKAAKKLFDKLRKKYPDSVHEQAIEDRGGDNAYLGTLVLHESGPPERRIDVSVMGDGFTIAKKDQRLEERWARLCLDVLYSEKAFSEYKSYFNYYFVRLASKEEGVDPKLSAERRRKIEKNNRNRVNKRKTEYSTALDCKAAGPQGQVMSDRRLVYKWLGIAGREVPGCADDRQVIAFARFGRLGMGGGGIANVGRPDRSVTVHEFGHSFVGLLDEYTGNPYPPRREIRAANAATTNDPLKVPWAHFLKAKVKGVGVFEGGATFSKGVWRPARGCAMNSAGNSGYCPVCREAAVLRIYSHVNPIDAWSPRGDDELAVKQGAKDLLSVTPMKPAKHKLRVRWTVQRIDAAAQAAPEDEEEAVPPRGPDRYGRGDRENWWRRLSGGRRARADRSAYARPPAGKPSRLAAQKGAVHTFPIGRLDPGTWQVTVQVRDPTPWVLEDDRHLLEERRTWRVRVRPR